MRAGAARRRRRLRALQELRAPGGQRRKQARAGGTERARTARFFVDGSECAVFAGIEDDGESSDWVAGITLTSGARVRLVPADGVELWSEMERAEAKHAAKRAAP